MKSREHRRNRKKYPIFKFVGCGHYATYQPDQHATHLYKLDKQYEVESARFIQTRENRSWYNKSIVVHATN